MIPSHTFRWLWKSFKAREKHICVLSINCNLRRCLVLVYPGGNMFASHYRRSVGRSERVSRPHMREEKEKKVVKLRPFPIPSNDIDKRRKNTRLILFEWVRPAWGLKKLLPSFFLSFFPYHPHQREETRPLTAFILSSSIWRLLFLSFSST